MRFQPSDMIATLFADHFVPPARAEALAGEIRKIAQVLGPVRFKDTIHALSKEDSAAIVGVHEKTLRVIIERLRTRSSETLSGALFVRRMNEVLIGLKAEEVLPTFAKACRRLQAAAYPGSRQEPRRRRSASRPQQA